MNKKTTLSAPVQQDAIPVGTIYVHEHAIHDIGHIAHLEARELEKYEPESTSVLSVRWKTLRI